MATLGALALVVTVVLAERALANASNMLVRGEAEALAATVVYELRDKATPEAGLEEVLAAHRDEGLRYVAVGERGGATYDAGERQIESATRPGDFKQVGSRARIVIPFPPRHGDPPFGAPGEGPFGPPHGPPPGGPGDDGPRFRHLVIELEPGVANALGGDLTRITRVGWLAGAALVAFAVAWSRSLKKLAELQLDVERRNRLVALGQMSSVMAHELRNPLASLKGHAQLLAETLEDDPSASPKAELVVREAERLESLTKNLLEFVRDGVIERARVKPSELMSEALHDVAADAVRVELQTTDDLYVDRARIARALHNLVENAVQASTEAKEPVVVTVRDWRKGVVIQVRDHGPGLPGVAIFEPFVTTRVRGTGLGLAIARRIAEQHGGSLTAENHAAGGAIFEMSLPSAREPK